MRKELDQDFMAILVSDVAAAISRRDMADTQAARRDVVRSAFAGIEGFHWVFREEVIDAAKATYGLEPEEEFVLLEETYSVNDKGEIYRQARFLPLMGSIRFLVRIANRITEQSTVDFSDAGWQSLRNATSTRNSVTHPKSEDDLILSDSDVSECLSAFYWILERLTQVLSHLVTTRRKYLGEFSEVLLKLKAGDPEVTALYNALKDEID